MQDNQTTLIVTGQDLQKVISNVGLNALMDQLIEESYLAFVNYDPTDSLMNQRSGYNYTEPLEGLVEWMPIRQISKDQVVIKVVGYHPRNPEHYQVPTIISTISQYDTNTGHLNALIDGVLPTSLRTGAAGAIASKLMANSQSESLGLIGCGAQSITQLHGISRVFDLKTVYYYDVDELTSQSFVSRAAVLGLDCEFIPAPIHQIIEQSDIVSTATSIGIGEGPLFQDVTSKDWLHINAIGSDFPGKFELPVSFLSQSYVCPDWVDQAVIEGECQNLESHQIGENLSHCLKSANEFEHLKASRTVFDSTGIALQDLVISRIILEHAKAMNVGQRVHIESTSLDEKNPYSFIKRLAKS